MHAMWFYLSASQPPLKKISPLDDFKLFYFWNCFLQKLFLAIQTLTLQMPDRWYVGE